MPHAEVAQAQPPKHRRSFSGIRSGFGLSSSPSLPVITSNSNQSALDITTPSRPSTSEGDKMRNAGHGGRTGMTVGSHSNLNLSSSSSSTSGSLLPGIRSLRSKFSFGTSSITPTTPARSVSNGSIGISGGGGGFMAKLPFGSLSRSNSKQKVFPLSSSSTELVSPFSMFQNRNDEETSPVMRISAFPPSPGSILCDHSLPGPNVSPSPTPAQPTPYYPRTLDKGIPRSPTLLSPSEAKVTGQKAHLAPLVQEDRSPSPSGRSLHSLQGVAVERRPSKLTIEQSRISEVTEPDSSVDFGCVSRPTSKYALPSSPLRSSSTSPIDELSSEGQISRELFEKHSGDSLTNLTIPPIPKSGSVLALDQNVPQLTSSLLPGSESSADHGTERYEDSSGTHSGDDDFVSAPPSARTSVDQPADRPNLDTLLSPHRSKHGPRASLQASTSTRGTVTPIISSTPLKRDGHKRVSRQSIKPLETWKGVHPTPSPSPPESPTRGDHVQRRSADGRESVSPTRSAFSSSIIPSDPRPSPSPSPFGHRRRQSVTQVAVPVIRPSLARSIAGSDKPPVAGTRKDYGALSATRARYSNTAASTTGSLDRYGSPELARPSSRTSPRAIGPRTDGENSHPARSYSSLSANTQFRPRRATADEVFGSSSGSRTTRCSPSEDGHDGTEFPMRHSSELRRPKWKDDSPRSATVHIRPDVMRPGSARGELSTDRLGPSTMRAFEEAGLVDPRDRSVISLPEHLRRPHTAMAESPLDRPLYGGRRSSDGRRSGESYYQTPIRSSIETARPDSVSGFTSSSNDHISHGMNGSSSGFHPSSPVSSGRTVYSSSGNNPYAMHDRYELEKEALLMALGESKRNVNDLQDENETLRTRNRELHAYAMELERKLANLERMVTERAPPDSAYSTRVIRRRAPIAVSPQLTDHSPSNSHLVEPPISRWLVTTPTPKARSPSPPVTAMDPSPRNGSASLVVPTHSLLPTSPSPAPQSRHRHTNSDASSTLPFISTTMSMLLNEKGPSNEDMTTSFRDDGILSNACGDDAIQRFKNALLGASTTTARPSTSIRHDEDESPTKSTKTLPRPATSPTEASFALTSAPASPGSMVLRTEDEIHLDDLMSFRDEFDG